MNINIVILAAGRGSRMFSELPKVLHPVGGKAILGRVLDTALSLNPAKIIIIYGYKGQLVKDSINQSYPENKFTWVLQEEQSGTGHALRCALPHLDLQAATLVLYGDVPLLNPATLAQMITQYKHNMVMLTAKLSDPSGYGRVMRDTQGMITKIVEEKDASASEKQINEINSGVYLISNKHLSGWLSNLTNNNSQHEYYLTDIVGMAHSDEVSVDWVETQHLNEISGVNDKTQLESLERAYQHSVANKLLQQGVTLADKARLDVRGSLTIGVDCSIDINCIFSGTVVLGNNVTIGAGCILHNVTLGDGVQVKAYSIIEGAVAKANAQIGPFARIRPGTNLAENVHIGNFVEVKNTTIGEGTKAGHLTYLGDANIGSQVNVGAGSVTCNYDGKNKWSTTVEDNVFIGSGTMMVAPVVIKSGGVIGAGSTITKNTEANELTVARSKQATIKGWLARKNKK